MHMDPDMLRDSFVLDSNTLVCDTDVNTNPENDSYSSLESSNALSFLGLHVEGGIEAEFEGDIFSQLARKEKYLLLAAEAGKELLDKNKVLISQNEKLKTEHASVVETLEQECFSLRKELLQKEEVHDSRMQELHSDIDSVREQLFTVQQASVSLGKFHKDQIEEMGEQNEFLIEELEQVKNRNQDLSFQVTTLRKRIEGRSSHHGFLDGDSRDPFNDTDDARHLREQNLQLQQQKRCLEETISECIAEKENAVRESEAAKVKIVSLEQELVETKQKVSLFQEELDESKHSNSLLKEQLEEYILRASTTIPRQTNKSLYDELEFTLSETDMSLVTKLQGSTPMAGSFQPMAASSHHGLHNLKRRRNFSAEETSESEEDDEHGEYIVNHCVLSFDEKSSPHNVEQELGCIEVKEMTTECYEKLLQLYQDLVKYCEIGSVESTSFRLDKFTSAHKNHEVSSSDLLTLIDSLQGFIRRIVVQGGLEQSGSKIDGLLHNVDENIDGLSVNSGSQREIDALEQQITQLNQKLNETRQETDKLKKEINGLKNNLREREDEVNTLNQKVNYEGRELKNLRQERELLLSTANIEDTLKKSILDRQEALQRENHSLLELEQMRSDMKKLNDQLVDAIQQKIELSEQLDEWQVDMAALIEKQLSTKLKGDHKKGRRRPFFNTRWNWSTLKTSVSKES